MSSQQHYGDEVNTTHVQAQAWQTPQGIKLVVRTTITTVITIKCLACLQHQLQHYAGTDGQPDSAPPAGEA